MAKSIEVEVRRLARGRCEYCHIPERAFRLRHVLDHIIARQHGGRTELQNLALCCGRCNEFKGPNIASIDPQTQTLSRLFNPRSDTWTEHFNWKEGVLIGTTPVGRATIVALNINLPIRIAARRVLMSEGEWDEG